MIGQLLDQRYKITQALSGGAFAHTFLAEDMKRPGNPICVVKKLEPMQSQPEFLLKARELFTREAQTLELLGKHTQIPNLLAHLEINGEFYLVEEYIAGKTLKEEFAAQGNKSESEAIQIVSELLEIVAFIHQENFIHRDIKPSNIIRNQSDGKLVLIDFGAVMESNEKTVLGTIIGTPGYAPLEQSQGLTGFNSDIYAVGIIAIQALTGIDPNLLPKNEQHEIIWQDNVAISQDFKTILTKMVQSDKSDRYQTAAEVLADLKQLNKPKIPVSPINPIQKKLIFPSLLIITIVALCLWLVTKFNQSSSPNLSLNGKVINHELNEEYPCQDLILEQDIYCQKYTLIGKKDQIVTIEMNSDDFDPLLILQNPNGDKLAHNGDRSINNWNAQIKAKLPQDGKYTLITRTTSPGESGKYTIRARLTE